MLLVPGPVDVPDPVLKASAYVQNHRSAEFREIVRRSSELIAGFSDSTYGVMTTGSGTTAVESIIYSMIAPGEKVLAVSFGEFGNRMVDSLHRRGADPVVIAKDHGTVIEKGEITDAFNSNRNISSVFLVHNETGNGTAIHNLKEISGEANELGLKVFVDSVSGFGGSEIKAESWGIHAFASCSQKGLASVPGLGIVSISEAGEKYVRDGKDAPAYLDLRTSLKFLQKNETPFTPSTGSFRAMLAALMILQKETPEKRWARHHTTAAHVREELKKTGFELYGHEKNYSDTVVAFHPPYPASQLAEKFSARGTFISRGMGKNADDMVRVGLLGVVDDLKAARFLNDLWELTGIDRKAVPGDFPAESRIDQEIFDIDL